MGLSHGKALDIGKVGLRRDDLPPLGEEPARSRFDFRRWFENVGPDDPLELEIGSGKGTFLVQQAAAHREVAYVGIEYAHKFWKYAADRCRRHGLENVRLVHEDAKVLIDWYAADEIFTQAHVYFPDPWPKKRHHKRRLLCESFFLQMHRVLVPGGVIRIVTDHDDYFQWIVEHAERVADRFESIPFTTALSGDAAGEMAGTNFERKYRREGRPFHATALRRIDGR